MPGAGETRSPNLEIVQLDSGVFAAIRRELLSLAVNSNSLIIARDSDVVVVDAQFTRAATQETIAAIRRITKKPVRYVINTHWHDDHVAGDQVYQDSFPSVHFVMQDNTAADFPTLGAANRRNQVQAAPAVADRFERLLALGLGIDSTPATKLESSAVASAIRIVRQYLKEAPGFRAVTATDTVRRRMTLGQGRQRVEILWFGNANTRGDLIVYLPSRGVVASRINREASAAVARRDSLGTALKTVTLDDVRLPITGDEKWMNFLFRQFFVRPAVQAAFEEVRREGVNRRGAPETVNPPPKRSRAPS